MNQILIVSATAPELELVLKEFNTTDTNPDSLIRTHVFKKNLVDVLITGAGMVNTAFFLGQMSGKKYDQVINAGICGAFNDSHKIGDVVSITEDCFSDLGAQDDEIFLSLSEINLGNEKVKCEHPVVTGKIATLPQVKGITVNTVHGNDAAINKIVRRLNPDVESMEGAAFLMACNHYKWPCAQIRAVSNKVEKRNRDSWNIPLAVKNLDEFLIEHLKAL